MSRQSKKKEAAAKATCENSSIEKKAKFLSSVINLQSPNSKLKIKQSIFSNDACSPVKFAMKSSEVNPENLGLMLLGKFFFLLALTKLILVPQGKQQSLWEYQRAHTNLQNKEL